MYAGLGDRDQALMWLEKARAEGDEFMVFAKVFPGWEGMHSDPRYADLLRRMNLSQ